MSAIAKLDIYDYTLIDNKVVIFLSGTNDPILVDILSEINNAYDVIYLEGKYYRFTGVYEIKRNINGRAYLGLEVELTGGRY